MRKLVNGYTLIELVMAISLLIIVLIGGTAIFYRSFRSSGVSDIQALLNSRLRSLDELIERSLRYGSVSRVGEKYRSDCLAQGDSGVTGNILAVRDPSGGVVTYTFLEQEGTVSSNSGVIISSPDIKITKLEFKWFCRSGINDKMNLYIEASPSVESGGSSKGVLNKDINLLNSGIN
jgi:type II secretory pathway pseudopilin PulG